MTTITIDSRGVATLPIEGADGTFDYAVLAAAPGLDEWACYVERVIKGPQGEGGPHRVSIDISGIWRCSCDAFKYRKSSAGPRGCKHTLAVGPLHALLWRLRVFAPEGCHVREGSGLGLEA